MKNTLGRFIAGALFFSQLAIPFAYAEQAPGDTPAAPIQQSGAVDADREKIAKIGEKIASQAKLLELIKEDITQLNVGIKRAENEERAVLRDQRRRKHAEIRDALAGLVRSINELESAGADTRAGRETAAAYARQVSAWLKADIGDSLKMLAAMDDRVKTASETDAPELRQQIADERRAVDEELAALLENSERMELLGLDNAPDLKYLDDTLTQRADNLVARLQYLVQQRNGLREQISGAGEDEKKRIKDKVSSLGGRISSTADNLKITIELMNERKLEAGKYKQILISSTGEITKEIFQSDVALGLLQQWLNSGKEWLINNGPQWAFKLIIAFLLLIVFSALAKMVRKIASRALSASRLHASKLLQDLFVSLVGKAVFLIGILIALAQVGVQIGPVLAGLGIVGFIIGFALQETLSNFASGVMILIYQPFDVGDAIEAGGVSGKVKQMSLVSTTITTFDNQRVIVPNKKIWGDVIRNMNAEAIRRIDMLFGIGYEDDIELADKVLHEIIENHELVLDDPAPVIRLHTLGESSVDFIVRPWVKTTDYWTAYWDITRSVKKRFDKEGISIPFP
ncbi:MAG: mechanosensitive ion channel, partial [Gammaproteobacteria bacterium]|nr:mechanosensitive ion channel [Gammaproteobacteria bacterium]